MVIKLTFEIILLSIIKMDWSLNLLKDLLDKPEITINQTAVNWAVI